MAQYLRDTVDFAAYMTETDAKASVRRASAFLEELEAEFAAADGPKLAHMFSTKLRDCIEFRPSEVTAWCGYNGHRKSMFTGQVALDLCVQQERVLMVSLEMTPQKTLARMCRQAAGTARPYGMARAFSGWTDGRLWLLDHLGRLMPEKTVAVCRYFANELKGTHVFIDSMMKVCQSEESFDEQKQLVSDLCDVAKETKLHIHLVAHCRKPSQDETRPPTKYDLRGSASISDQCHNVLTIWSNKVKAIALQKNPHDEPAKMDPDFIVGVEKQRNGEYEGKVGLWFHKPSMRFMDDRVSLVQPYDFLNPDRRQ